MSLRCTSGSMDARISRLRGRITGKYSLLIITSVSKDDLNRPLGRTGRTKVPIVSCSHLLVGSSTIACCTAFSGCGMNRGRNRCLMSTLSLSGRSKPFGVRLFANSPNSGGYGFFFNKTVSILRGCVSRNGLMIGSKRARFRRITATG